MSKFQLCTTETNGYCGSFSKEWKPTKEGTYEIIASFAVLIHMEVQQPQLLFLFDPATTEVSIPERIIPPDYTMTIIGVGIAVIITVVLIEIVLYRKK